MNVQMLECQGENIAAYLDGELDAADAPGFEQHLKDCAKCSTSLREQRSFLCELDFALTREPAPALPTNFVEVVAANAQSDVRGMRSTVERVRAFRICVVLILASVVLLGSAVGDFVTAAAKPFISVGDFAVQTIYGIGAGATIISRSVGVHFLLESSFSGVALIILFAAAIALLPAMISRYHRSQS